MQFAVTLVRLLGLLLQGPRSYFYASLGWANIDGEGQGGAEAAWSWTSWHPDLSRPLGQPLGPATKTPTATAVGPIDNRTGGGVADGSGGLGGGFLYSRSFAAGTNVSLLCGDASCKTASQVVGCIAWADGNITGTCPPTILTASTES
jgi:hypothetical protein